MRCLYLFVVLDVTLLHVVVQKLMQRLGVGRSGEIISFLLPGRLTSISTPTVSDELLPLWMTRSVRPLVLISLSLFVPGILEKVGDNIFEMFLMLVASDALKHMGQIGLEQLDLLALEALLEVGLIQTFAW